MNTRMAPSLCIPDNCLSQETLTYLLSDFKASLDSSASPEKIFRDLVNAIRIPYISLSQLETANHTKEMNHLVAESRAESIISTERYEKLSADHTKEMNHLVAESRAESIISTERYEKLSADHMKEMNHLVAESRAESIISTERYEKLSAKYLAEWSKATKEFENQSEYQRSEIKRALDCSNIAVNRERIAFDALQNYLLRLPPQVRPELKSSVTRATNWREQKAKHAGPDRPLYVDPNLLASIKERHSQLVNRLFDGTQTSESQLYEPFHTLISSVLSVSGMNTNELPSTFNTSRTYYLGGFAPDISVCVPGVLYPDPSSVLLVIDLKQHRGKLATDEDLGQIYDYLIEMSIVQTGRRFFVGILSNIKNNIVVTLEKRDCSSYEVIQHHETSIYAVFAYILGTVVAHTSHRPPDLGFSVELGKMRRRLGNPRNSLVAEFLVPGSHSEVMAVKRSNGVKAEIGFLDQFYSNPTRPECIPLLVFESGDRCEFGITPVGSPLIAGNFSNHIQIHQILDDVIEALFWLQNQSIVHRDIRAENIIITRDSRAVLIDFDCAYKIGRNSLCTYKGGFICCPPRHIKNVILNGWTQRYTPSISDDCYGLVLLVNYLLFPRFFAHFQTTRIGMANTEESRRLLQLWDTLEKSPVWGTFVEAAMRADLGELRKMKYLFAML